MLARAFPVVLSALLAPRAAAQSFSVTLPDTDWVRDIEELPGGALAVLSTVSGKGSQSWVTVLDAAGQPVRQRVANQPLYDLAVRPGGTLLAAGSAASVIVRPWALAFDPLAGDQWSRVHTELAPEEGALFYSAVPSASGGWITAGAAFDEDNPDLHRAVLARYDANGTVQWSGAFGVVADADVVELPSGETWVAGGFGSAPFVGVELTALSPLGAVLWSRRASLDHAQPRLAQRTGGEVVLTSLDGLVVQLDGLGQSVRTRRIVSGPFSQGPSLRDVTATPDGGFAVVGTRWQSWADQDVLVVKFDASGELEWQRLIGDAGAQEGLVVRGLANGDLAVGARSHGQALVVRVDAQGAVAGCEPLPAWEPLVDETLAWIDVNTQLETLLGTTNDGPASASDALPAAVATCLGGPVGTRVCSPAVPNSGGAPAVLWAGGDELAAANDLTLAATDLPPKQFGYFLTGQSSGTVVPPGSQGVLCLVGGPIHRYVDEVFASGEQGAAGRAIDVTAVPGHGAIQPGETWYFQAWFRDVNPLPTSNFTDAVGVTFF